MNLKELREEKKKVKKEISKLENQLDKLDDKYIKENCKFKKGDVVEFVSKEYPDDSNYEYDVYRKEEIMGFTIDEKTGEIKANFPYSWNSLDYASIKDVQLFNSYNYTLRLKFAKELDLDDEFILAVDKPKSTKGKKYKVCQKSEYSGGDIIYQYYNDYGKLQTLSKGEYVNLN